MVPGIYYTNIWYTVRASLKIYPPCTYYKHLLIISLIKGFLPMMTASVYDNTGADYNVTKVLSPQGTLDPVAYAAYSPPFLSATFAFVYGLSFASITSVIVHVYLWNGKEIYDALRGRQPLDIHARLMRSYKKVPLWWYGIILVVFTALSIVLGMYTTYPL